MTWPTKDDFVDGDVLTAAQVNNIGTNLNLYDPTSATSGQVPIADGAGSVAFGTPVSGGMTSITSGTLSTGSGTLTLSSIPGTYKDLMLVLRAWRPANSGAGCDLRFNNASGTNYYYSSQYANNTPAGGAWTSIVLNALSLSNTLLQHHAILIHDYATAQPQLGRSYWAGRDNTNTIRSSTTDFGFIPSTNAAITRIDVILSSGNFGAGTYELFGVN